MTEKREAWSCPSPTGEPALGPAVERTVQIAGRKTGEAFELLVAGTAVTPLPIIGTHATVTLGAGVAGLGTKVTYTIDCVNC